MIDILSHFSPVQIQTISSESLSAERIGKLTDLQLDLIYKNRWFHLLVPKSIGGDEMALPEFARFMEAMATIDGSFAWNVNLGAGANMFAGFLDQQVAATLFLNARTCVAGSGAIGGTAERKNGGFVINGFWKYASGSAHASYFSLNARFSDGEEDSSASFLVPAAEVEVLNTWNVIGMKATSSCDFKVSGVWVPESYRFSLRSSSTTVASPLYQFPFVLLAEINMLVMATGLAIQFHELVKKIADGIVVMRTVKSSLLEKREVTFSLLDRLWREVELGRPISVEMEAAFSESVAETANAARQLVDGLYPFAGMSVVFHDNQISRVYRDFKVASQHALLRPAGQI